MAIKRKKSSRSNGKRKSKPRNTSKSGASGTGFLWLLLPAVPITLWLVNSINVVRLPGSSQGTSLASARLDYTLMLHPGSASCNEKPGFTMQQISKFDPLSGKNFTGCAWVADGFGLFLDTALSGEECLNSPPPNAKSAVIPQNMEGNTYTACIGVWQQ